MHNLQAVELPYLAAEMQDSQLLRQRSNSGFPTQSLLRHQIEAMRLPLGREGAARFVPDSPAEALTGEFWTCLSTPERCPHRAPMVSFSAHWFHKHPLANHVDEVQVAAGWHPRQTGSDNFSGTPGAGSDNFSAWALHLETPEVGGRGISRHSRIVLFTDIPVLDRGSGTWAHLCHLPLHRRNSGCTLRRPTHDGVWRLK